MKLLYVITGLTRAGAEKQLYTLVRHVHKKINVSVVAFRDGPYAQELRDLGVRVTIIPASLFSAGSTLTSLLRVIHNEQPDIVHSFLPHANVLCKLAKLFSRQRFNLICSIRVKEISYLLYNLAERVLDFACDMTTTNSAIIKEYLVNSFFFNPKKIQVIQNGLDFRTAKPITLYPRKKKIITIANFRAQKDYTTNVLTCEQLAKLRNDFIFLYVGKGEELNRIRNLVSRKNLTQHVDFLLERSDIPELLLSSDVFFLPTLYEGQSNALIEAMHYGCPIVTTDIPENRDVVDGAALLVPRRSPSEMALAINKLFTTTTLSQALKRKGQQQSKRFSSTAMAKAYLKLYSTCAAS